MSSGIPPLDRRTPRLRRPGRTGTIVIATGVAVVVVVAGLALTETLLSPTPTLTIYTYPSLFGGADCGAPAFATVFGAFASAHHISIQVECPSGDLASTLDAQKDSPGADLVIGLDELTASEAADAGLLVPYAPPGLSSVPADLVSELSPDHAVVPYEYGYLAIDYNDTFLNATDGAIADSSFVNFTQNSSWAKQLEIEDPLTDITGEEFLAWQIEFYTEVLHQNWQNFWKELLPYAQVSDSWGDAFAAFTSPTDNPMTVVSYTTDPAYAIYNGEYDQFNSTVTSWNGSLYGWKTIYGIGIVAGTHHLALDEEFENWFLNATVQNEIPLNEWEYPANATTPLPAVYGSLIPPSSIDPLNDFTTPSALSANLTGWQDTWQELDNSYGAP